MCASGVLHVKQRRQTDSWKPHHLGTVQLGGREIVEIRGSHNRLNPSGNQAEQATATRSVKLAHDIVEQKEGVLTRHLGNKLNLGELDGKDKRALLAL